MPGNGGGADIGALSNESGMNVLLIAPDLGLTAVNDEVRAVSLALHPVILNGTVTRRDVLQALQSHIWDVIWFATHGNERGIKLSDGYITINDLTAIVRASNAWLVILNTCSSRLIGLELHYELQVSVITTVTEIDDITAYQTGALLAQALAKTKDVKAAYDMSKPGQNASYMLFYDYLHDEATETRTILMLNEWGYKLSSKIDALERRMNQEINALRKDIDQLNINIDIAVRLSPLHHMVFIGAFVLLFLPIPLFYVEVREMLGIDWQLALSLAILSYTASAVLWSYMWWGGRR
ncbi:MAG: hypothetical protein J7457_05935 [Roseiflexus sp.]|nr:hypothetical protein [Roseiflexus sp.]